MVTDVNDSAQSKEITVAAGGDGEQAQPAQSRTPQPGQAEQPVLGAAVDKRPDTRAATLRLPFLTARFEVPRAPSGRLHVGPVTLPSPRKAVYYLGLGALAIAEIIEWPVAVAIGAGTYVAQHTRAEEPTLPQLELPPAKPEHRGDAEQEHPEAAAKAAEPEHPEPARGEQREPAAAPA